MKQRSTPAPGSVKALENTLDDLVRKILRKRESVCYTDGRSGTAGDPLEVSHLFGRAMRPTRFDVGSAGNNHLMHRSCNRRHNDDKSIYIDAFVSKHGQQAYDKLERRALQGPKFDYITLLGMLTFMEQALERS